MRPEDAEYILDMLCSALEPFSSYKQVKDSTTKNGKDTALVDVESAKPEIAEYITLGFNNTNEALESQARRFYSNCGLEDLSRHGNNMTQEAEQDKKDVNVVFVCKQDMKSALLWNHFPTLCTAANMASGSKDKELGVRLVQLPLGSHTRLANAAGLERLSVVGLKTSPFTTQLEKRLMDNEIGILETPGWMNQLKLQPVKISSVKTSAPIKPSKNQLQKQKADKQKAQQHKANQQAKKGTT